MQSWFRHVMLVLAVALAIAIVAMFAGSSRTPESERAGLAGVLAKVNGEKLDWKLFEMNVERELDEISKTRSVDITDEVQKRGEIFDRFVDEVLRLQAAKREGVRVSRFDVRERINATVERLVEQDKQALLARVKGKKTEMVFEAQLARVEPGLTIAKLKARYRKSFDPKAVRRSLVMEKLEDKLRSQVRVSDSELRAAFEVLKLRQITVGMQGRSETQAEKRARNIVGELRKGAGFAELAKDSSDDFYRSVGGDRGYVSKAMLEPEVAAVAFKLASGRFSDPIKTPQGYVIIKVEDRRENLPPGFEDPNKRKQYREQYLVREQDRLVSQYYQRLRKEARMEIYDPEMRAYLLVKDLGASLGSAGPSTDPKKGVQEVIKAYRSAIAESERRPDVAARSYFQIAMLYSLLRGPVFYQTTSNEERKQYDLETMKVLENALEYTESNYIRMALGRMYIDVGKYDKAVEHLDIASENAYDDSSAHDRICALYKRMKRPDLAAKEQKWIDDYRKRSEEEGETSKTPEPVPGGSR